MGCGEDEYSCSPSPPGSTGFTLPPVFSPPSTRIQIDDGNRRLTIVIVVSSALAACFLLLIYFIVLCYRRRSRRQRAAASVAMTAGPPLPPADVDDDLREELLMGMGGGGEPHHVWYIRTVGLDQGTIGAITVWTYKSGEGLVEGTDCAVCLGEFGDGELLRLLPKCSHAFHIPCIDTWLRSHLNCPLCRAPILAPPSPSLPPPPHPVTAPEISSEEGSGSDDDERWIAAALPPSQVEAAAAAAVAAEEEEEEEDIWVPIDLGDHAAASVDAPQVQGNGGDGGPCPVPRSVSMDSSALAGLLLRMRLVGCSGDCRWKPSVGEDASSITEKGSILENNCKVPSSLHAPLEMERSMSGGRFFFTRLSGRTRGAILPL